MVTCWGLVRERLIETQYPSAHPTPRPPGIPVTGGLASVWTFATQGVSPSHGKLSSIACENTLPSAGLKSTSLKSITQVCLLPAPARNKLNLPLRASACFQSRLSLSLNIPVAVHCLFYDNILSPFTILISLLVVILKLDSVE